MDVVDLAQEHVGLWLQCLEPWSDEMKDAGEAKRLWYEHTKDRGLRVKLARDDDGAIVGMIQYLPIEHALVDGNGLFFIQCLWVHGHKHGSGNRQGRGAGTALLEAAEADARQRGAKGMAAQGLWLLPFWQRAGWFRRHGYAKADRAGLLLLMWKRFAYDAEAPSWIREGGPPAMEPGKVVVTAYVNGWCPAQNITMERARRAAADLGDPVVFRRIDVSDRESFRLHGHADAVFIDGRALRMPPPSYEKIRRTIEKRLTALR